MDSCAEPPQGAQQRPFREAYLQLLGMALRLRSGDPTHAARQEEELVGLTENVIMLQHQLTAEL